MNLVARPRGTFLEEYGTGFLCAPGAKRPPAPRWGWETWPMRAPHDEVIGFLVALINTLPDMAEKRGRPRLGSYLV